mgnify:CR=1 FL=1
MSDKLKLKSIYELLYNEEGKAESFFIPSYQRGYRWTKQQVEELLEDILEFEKTKNQDEFYCLQPVVVKRNKDNSLKWDVLDGQQRLTTIKIILTFFNNRLSEDYRLKIYDIFYETRDSSHEYLMKIDEDRKTENIDFFHIYNAYETIKKWFSTRMNIINDFESTLLNKTKIIWYEIEHKENSLSDLKNKYKEDIEIFTRINMGKIPLTNAELIKALLIQGYSNQNNDELKKNKQFELASEWDYIEYSLQNDNFWYFINKDKNEKATRIEFIFELIAEKYFNENQEKLKELRKSKPIDKYYEFHIINHYLQNNNQRDEEKNEVTIYEKLWNEVKNYFRILNEWYEDREFFHKVGFLAIYSSKIILDFITEYTKVNSTKKEFKNFLDTKIKEVFKNNNEFIDIESLTYDDKNDIRKVLLWFNLSTIIKNDKSNLRFQFDRYKTQSWDIEHIRSQTDKYPEKGQRETWITSILDFIKDKNEIEDIINMKDQEFKQFFDDLQKEIEGDDEFKKDDIGNLTLLDSKTNRGYGNAFFPIKRKTIIENDMNGTFIPICTKNLFLKYYTDDVEKLDKWQQKDAEDYKNTILKTFNELKQGNENEQQ